jgi:cholesterol transport system auxiliary component
VTRAARIPSVLVLAALAFALAGCGGILPKPPPSPDLYTLTAPPPPSAPAAKRLDVQILVALPQSTSALDSERIAVSQSPTTFEYYAGAAWTDHAPGMLQALLVETLERSGLFAAVARGTVGLRADYSLVSDLRHFEAEYRGGPPQARIEIDLKLVKSPEGGIVAERDFDVSVPAASNTVSDAVVAFDTASHRVLVQAAPWIASVLPAAAGHAH